MFFHCRWDSLRGRLGVYSDEDDVPDMTSDRRINSSEHEQHRPHDGRRHRQYTHDENEALYGQNEAEHGAAKVLRYESKFFVESFHVFQRQFRVEACNTKKHGELSTFERKKKDT